MSDISYKQFSESFNQLLSNYLNRGNNTKSKVLNDLTEVIILSVSNYLSGSELTIQEQRLRLKRLSEPSFLKELIIEKERLASNQDYSAERLIKRVYQQVIL